MDNLTIIIISLTVLLALFVTGYFIWKYMARQSIINTINSWGTTQTEFVKACNWLKNPGKGTFSFSYVRKDGTTRKVSYVNGTPNGIPFGVCSEDFPQGGITITFKIGSTTIVKQFM